jgi:tetratricopeptide (TPR) repeat protein
LLVKDAKGATDGGEQARMLGRAGGIFLELGDAVSAVPVLREAAALVPDDPDLVVSLIDAYLLAGWFDDANEQLDNIINGAKGKRTPEIAPFFHRKAQVAEAQGDRAKQLQWLQEAHNCAKKNGVFAAQLADLAEQLEQWDLATKTLRMITLLDTECPISKADAFYRQGRIALIQGDDKNARMWGRRARREDPASPEIENFLRELGEKV